MLDVNRGGLNIVESEEVLFQGRDKIRIMIQRKTMGNNLPFISLVLSPKEFGNRVLKMR